ncbi:hypothetical protein BDZ45DRAFT_808993 [Acephala macrosclerotiorum]|nr:hypothetical protein BDZ45DRAFT_808993 [Acephala macrosclerotiorum]
MAGSKEEKMTAAAVICTCNKRFKSEIDMAKHLLDSPRHTQDTATNELQTIAKSPSPPLPSKLSEPPRISTPPTVPPPAPTTKALKDFEKLLERLSLPGQEKDESCDSIASSDRDTLRNISPNMPSKDPSASTSRPEETVLPVGENTDPAEESKKYWDIRKKANISTRDLNRYVDEDLEFEVVMELETEIDVLDEDWVICEKDCICCTGCPAGNL